MAASDRNRKGKRSDYARHYSLINGGSPACGEKNYGYSTNDTYDVDCLKCTSWIMKTSSEFNDKQKTNPLNK